MIFRKFKFLFSLCAFLSGCSFVLDEPELSTQISKESQQRVEVKIHPLTKDAVRRLNNQPFIKTLVIPKGDRAKLFENGQDFRIDLPSNSQPLAYKIGIGDVLQLNTISSVETSAQLPDSTSNLKPTLSGALGIMTAPAPIIGDKGPTTSISISTSRVSADGSVLFIETGRLNVLDKTTSEVRDLVNDALIRNGLDTRFQLEITKFESQFVSLISYNSPVNNLNSDSQIGAALYPISEKPLSLRELLVGAGLLLKKNVVDLVSIQRNRQLYQATLSHIFHPESPDFFLIGGDLVTVETFKYKQDNAYIMGGRSTPSTIKISEEEPVSLANALFNSGGVLASQASKKSEVYLLRGSNPVVAYHLDATDAARLILSAELELRPNDIVFASTVRIVDFNTVLGLINPLRILTGQEQPLFSPAF